MKKLIYALFATALFVFFASGAQLPVNADAAVNMSTIAAGTNYLANPVGPVNGFFRGTDQVKLDALPTATALATQISTAVDGKLMPIGSWCATGSPATTALRQMPDACTAAPVGTPFATSQQYAVPMALTCTSITATYVQAVQATDNITFCLMKNGAVTALCTTLTPSVAASTSTGSVAVALADNLAVQMVQSGSAASTANTRSRVSISCKSP